MGQPHLPVHHLRLIPWLVIDNTGVDVWCAQTPFIYHMRQLWHDAQPHSYAHRPMLLSKLSVLSSAGLNKADLRGGAELTPTQGIALMARAGGN
jgi:hypothetical protein